jgi:ATP-dependent Clp protease ATP-binding subunit ClpA
VQAEITELRLNDLIEWHRQRGCQIKISPEVLPFLIYRGFSRRLGARPLIGFIEAQVGNAIVRRLMADGQANGTLVVQNDQLVLLP